MNPTTTVEAELKYLDDIVACANLTTGAVSLTNNSELVWGFFDASTTTRIKPLAQSLEVMEFHTIFQDLYGGAFMAPGENVEVMGGIATLQWAIHPELSLAWTANGFILKQIKKKGEAAFKDAITGQSVLRRAAWDCTVAVYDVGTKAPGLIKSAAYDPAAQIGTGLGLVGSTGTCARSWMAAEREAGSARMPQWVQFADEADTALRPASELFEKSSTLKKAVAGTLRLICDAYSRC